MIRFFEPLWKSFYSASFYRSALKEGISRSLLFLLFVTVLCASVSAVKLHLELIDPMKDDLPYLISQVPEMKINDGRLSTVKADTSVPDPVYVIRTKEGTPLAVIDETAEAAPEDLGGAQLYITRNEAVIKKSSYEKRVYSFSQIHDLSIDQLVLKKWAVRVYYFAGLASFPFLFLGLYFYRFFQAVIVSLFAKALFFFRKEQRSCSESFVLSVYALTPPVIIGTAVDIATGHGYIGFFLTLVLACVFVVCGAVFSRSSQSD